MVSGLLATFLPFGSGLQVAKGKGGATEAKTVNQPFSLAALIYAPNPTPFLPAFQFLSPLIIILVTVAPLTGCPILISPNPEMTLVDRRLVGGTIVTQSDISALTIHQ